MISKGNLSVTITSGYYEDEHFQITMKEKAIDKIPLFKCIPQCISNCAFNVI